MARVVKEEEHAVKRREILSAAQQLVFTKGYEQMSIQDIVETLQISKGAFYHYFGSKPALLDGLIEIFVDEAEEMLDPIVAEPHLSAVNKFRRYFAAAVRWKTAQKEFILTLLRIWYTDQNAIVRQKQQAMALKRVAPKIAAIVRQGIDEGTFTARFPDQTAMVILSLSAGLGDIFAELLLAPQPLPDVEQQIEKTVAAYTEAVERVLGVAAGSLTLMDPEMLKQWMPAPAMAADGHPDILVLEKGMKV
jgi:AcrR family transcriptional regulator